MEKKKQKYKKIIAGTIAIILTFSSIVVFLYWDEIKTAYNEKKANKPGWSTEDNYGSIEIIPGDDIEYVEPDYIYDALGIRYLKNNFITEGYSVTLPADWKVTTYGNRIYTLHPDAKNDFSQIEISIIPLSEFEEGTNLVKLRNNTITMLDSSFRYHGYNDSYEIISYEITDVVVDDTKNILYHPLKATLKSLKVSDDKFYPFFISYYMFIGNEGYVVSGVGPKSKEIYIEEITKMVANSMEQTEFEKDFSEYKYDTLNVQCYLNNTIEEDVKYMVGKDWELIYASNPPLSSTLIGTHCYRLSNDINDPEFNMVATISMVKKSEDLSAESYKNKLLEIYAKGNYPEEIDFYSKSNSADSVTTLEVYDEEVYSKNLKNGKLSHYIQYCAFPASEYYYNAIQVGNYPIYNFVYSINISEKYDILINITHNEFNEEIAKEYIYKLIDGLSF